MNHWGIILTAGTFTQEAKREARRDGARPIELFDRDKLVDMFEELELGPRSKTVFEIDDAFFEEPANERANQRFHPGPQNAARFSVR